MEGKRFYQPALLEEHIRALYRLKVRTGLPMTYHARLAVEQYVDRWSERGELSRRDGTDEATR